MGRRPRKLLVRARRWLAPCLRDSHCVRKGKHVGLCRVVLDGVVTPKRLRLTNVQSPCPRNVLCTRGARHVGHCKIVRQEEE
jgi:hypothetical protein